MIPNDVENNISHSISNISTASQPSTTATSSSRGNTNYSSINTLITTDTRRSVRLSAKSSKRISSLNQSSIHRTISGGVALTHSPKLYVLSVVSPERKRELHTAAVNCILRDGLALGVFRQPGMSQFLQIAVPGYAGPNGKTVRQKIAAIYSSYTTKLRSVLSKVDFFALTCDLWRSSKRVHYISLTGHVFTNKYKTVSIVLGCHRVIGRHLSTTIERYIEFELKRLNIKQEQLVSITTDNGSDMKKATSTLKFDLSSNSDDWDDINDIDYGASDIDKNLIAVATYLLSDEDKDDDNEG
ncbi:unnamed protein product [Rotaria sp. Silwood1]|nr:unnamed protein product [Rotaria sp. Silwood1]